MNATHYVNGDRAEYTGESKLLHGRRVYETKIVEGHREGEFVWTYIPPHAKGPERNPGKWTR